MGGNDYMTCCDIFGSAKGVGRLFGVAALAIGLGALAAAAYAAYGDKGDRKVDPRVFELRTYTPAPGKMSALERRFRDHTINLFDKHGLTVVGFWKPLDAKEGEEKLVYLLAFPSKDAADKAWKEFRDDADWKKAKDESETDGPLLAKPPESVFLSPTEYSPLK
jgi:hypothetical protein